MTYNKYIENIFRLYIIINKYIIIYYMSLTVVSYTPNISSIPLKQYSNVRYTNIEGGMPMKSGFADNTSNFSQGRTLFTKSANGFEYLYDENK